MYKLKLYLLSIVDKLNPEKLSDEKLQETSYVEFIKTIASSTGILLDQVYTGKMMMAVFELAKQDYFKPKSKLLLVHTGGLLGLLSQ